MSSSKQIDDRHEIKTLLQELKNKPHLFSFKSPGGDVEGTFQAFDHSYDQVKFVLERPWQGRLGTPLIVEFTHKGAYYRMEIPILRTLGSSVYTPLPMKILLHPGRSAKRLPVLGQKVPVRITFLGIAKNAAQPSAQGIRRPELAAIFLEMQKEVPELTTVVQQAETLLRRFGDRSRIVLGTKEAPPAPAESLFQQMLSLYLPETAMPETFRARDPDLAGVGQFADFLEGADPEERDALVEKWEKDARDRKVSSEVWAPIFVVGGRVGWLWCATDSQSDRRLGITQALVIAGLGDAIGEVVMKRNMNNKGAGQKLGRVEVADLSEGGMKLVVHDPILIKLMRVATAVRIDLAFFKTWVSLPATVVRVHTPKGKSDTGIFSVKFDQEDVSSQDRVIFKRVLAYHGNAGNE